MTKKKKSSGYTDQYGNTIYETKTIDWFPIIIILAIIILISIGLYFRQQNPNLCALLSLLAIFIGISFFISRFLGRHS